MTKTASKKATVKAAKKTRGSKSRKVSKAGSDKKKKLEDKLGLKRTLIWTKLDNRKINQIMKFCEEYKNFLDLCKTERETISFMVKELKGLGFKPLSEAPKTKIKPGMKFYEINREKNLSIIIIGKKPLENGLNLIAAHVDAPRLDLKQNPLYEDGETQLALLKTHYYGGLKKYQWVNIPLAIHGKIIKSDGKELYINVGEKPDDPVFVITDLLPHLAHKRQAVRKISEAIKGEDLNILIGSLPIKDKGVKKKVKLWVLNYLNKNYGIVEEDFVSAEIEVVPAGKAQDIGFDRSLIGAYGQDDRASAYTTFRGILDINIPEYTAVGLFIDKEEIGSDGPTSIRSRFIVDTIGNILGLIDNNYRESTLRTVLKNSRALSADVNAGINPMFKEVHEKMNAAKLGYGIVVTKFTGSGGKYLANDASAEYMGAIRRMLNNNKIPWQTAELGKVDEGGGGTVAKHIAIHNMDVIDIGPPVLSMHSPMEITSKVDIFYTYETFRTFFKMKW
jgi:aspartyl aminopeptidase